MMGPESMSGQHRWWLLAGASGALGVLLGAFGAHGLEARLEELGRVATFETATLYHLVHAAVLVGIACGIDQAQDRGRRRRLERAGVWFLAGIVLFSGSLYVLALTDATWLGMVAPFGGTAFVVGWILVARAGLPAR